MLAALPWGANPPAASRPGRPPQFSGKGGPCPAPSSPSPSLQGRGEVRTEEGTGSVTAWCGRPRQQGPWAVSPSERLRMVLAPGVPRGPDLGPLPGPSACEAWLITTEWESRSLPPQGSSLSVAVSPSPWRGAYPHLLGNSVTAKGQRPCSPAWKSSDSLRPYFPISHL